MLIDFDHGVTEVERPIRLQGIYKRDVRGRPQRVDRLRRVHPARRAASATTRRSAPARWSRASFPANAVLGGVPARVIRMREAPEHDALGVAASERRREQSPGRASTREVAQPGLTSRVAVAPPRERRARASRGGPRSARAHRGRRAPRVTMKAQSLACSASMLPIAAAPTPSRAAARSSSAARAANAMLGDRRARPGREVAPLPPAAGHPARPCPGSCAGSSCSSASSRRTSSRPCREHSSHDRLAARRRPRTTSGRAARCRSAHTTRPPPGRPASCVPQPRARARDEVGGVLARERQRRARGRRRSPSLPHGLWWWTVWWW